MALANMHSGWTCVALPGLAITLVHKSLILHLGVFSALSILSIHEALEWFLGNAYGKLNKIDIVVV